MNLILSRDSVCELTYMLRDAILADNLNVAEFLSKQIHTKLLEMKRNGGIDCQKDCKLDCELKDNQ